MKLHFNFLPLILCGACLAQHEPALTPAPPLPAKDALQSAARAFCGEVRRELIQGLPSHEQLQRLSPFITPALAAALKEAQQYQDLQVQAHPDEKPLWADGDLFSSLVEGVTQWEVGEAFVAPMVEATVEVSCVNKEPGQPVEWTDRLVLQMHEGTPRVDDIRFGGVWLAGTGAGLRAALPGGIRQKSDHTSLNGRWKIDFDEMDRYVAGIRLSAANGKGKPQVLFDDSDGQGCSFPTWVVWNADCTRLAVRLGDSPRFNRTLVFRLDGNAWKPVDLPEFYLQERKTMEENGFRERHRLIDALRWQDNQTLVVRFFSNFTKEEEGDGYHRDISVEVNAKGKTRITGAVEADGEY